MQYLCGMKHRIIHIALLLTSVCNLAAQTIISGMVKSGQEPLAGANVFIMGTIDGCLTDSLGRFSFSTSKTGEASIKITMIGFEEYMQTTDACKLHNLSIQMKEKATAIQEVVISASTYSFGKSDNFKTMDALDVVMAGNSCGDIVAALQTLPGTQKVGENGKLYVRGGESEECQTFINGMHVLVPYSTNTENTTVRGRFSPFIFKGINFLLVDIAENMDKHFPPFSLWKHQMLQQVTNMESAHHWLTGTSVAPRHIPTAAYPLMPH